MPTIGEDDELGEIDEVTGVEVDVGEVEDRVVREGRVGDVDDEVRTLMFLKRSTKRPNASNPPTFSLTFRFPVPTPNSPLLMPC